MPVVVPVVEIGELTRLIRITRDGCALQFKAIAACPQRSLDELSFALDQSFPGLYGFISFAFSDATAE